jgi:hypothetical protein
MAIPNGAGCVVYYPKPICWGSCRHPTYVPEDKKTLFAFFAFFAD